MIIKIKLSKIKIELRRKIKIYIIGSKIKNI